MAFQQQTLFVRNYGLAVLCGGTPGGWEMGNGGQSIGGRSGLDGKGETYTSSSGVQAPGAGYT